MHRFCNLYSGRCNSLYCGEICLLRPLVIYIFTLYECLLIYLPKVAIPVFRTQPAYIYFKLFGQLMWIVDFRGTCSIYLLIATF